MIIKLNGENKTLRDGLSIKDLLVELNLAGGPVAVMLNDDIIRKDSHEKTVLHDGDRLEVVSFVGGG
jgi:thiamine biosynthesis protein ThiS